MMKTCPLTIFFFFFFCSITIHNASWDYANKEPRHGTRVTSLAEKPFFDPSAPTRREALGWVHPDELKEEQVNLDI